MVGDMAMRTIYRLMILLLFFILYACSKDSEVKVECPLTVDTFTVLLTKQYEGKEYYLAKRISGWHEKTVIIQLFDRKPRLGECNEDLVKPIFEDSIDTEKPLEKMSVDLKSIVEPIV